MAQAGMVLGGRYELAEQVGNGGYCEVWRATDTVLSRPVAVKLLHPGYTRKTEALARFRAEARHAGALSHQNIARVYDYGESADGQPPYLVMELVDGPSLEDVLGSGPLDARESMDVIAQAAAGLHAAHEVGLIHRDVKPANLLLASDGMVKITDFGIAHAVGSVTTITPSGEMIGTPGYHAPEQVTGEQVTPASDLYALGVVAYECLAGTPPFAGTAVEMAVAHRDRPLPPLPPSVPADMSAFVMQLTAKDPARRPRTAAEVALRAGRLRDGQAGNPAAGMGGGRHAAAKAPVTVAAARQPHPGRRRPALALAVTVLAGLTCLVLASLIGFGPSWHVIRGSSSKPPIGTRGTAAPVTTAGSSPAAQPRITISSVGATATATTTIAPAASAATARTSHGNGRGNGKGNGKGNGYAAALSAASSSP